MSKTDQYSKRIANYLFNDMDSEETSAFEDELNVDPDFAIEFKRQSEMLDYLKTKSRLDEIEGSPDMAEAERVVAEFFKAEEAESKGEAFGTEQPKSVPISIYLRRVLFPIMAAAAVVSGILLFRNMGQLNMGDRLYSSYYKPLNEVSFTGRGEGVEVYEEFRMAIDQYLKEDFAKSTRMLSSLVAENPDFPEAQLYLGLSLMGVEEFPSSVEVFESYLANSTKYVYEAKWYLALCYLKVDDYQSAKTLIDELSGMEGALGRDAEKISKRLDRIK